MKRVLRLLSFLSAAAIGLFAALIWLGGDVWWLGTVALFAPRWPLLLPWGAVAACCVIWSRKLLWLHLASGFMLWGPVMGFCLPSFSKSPADAAPFRLRLMTVNAGGGIDPRLLEAEIQSWQPDIVMIQESSRDLSDRLFGDGWHRADASGLCIASRFAIEESQVFPGKSVGRWGNVGLRARITTTEGGLWVNCLHLETPRPGFEELALTREGLIGTQAVGQNTSQRAVESQQLGEWVGTDEGPALVAGDLNTPVESKIYRRSWSGYQNAFSIAGWGLGHTKFTRWHGVRIDHILASEHFTISACHVGEPIGGDHRPVVAELTLRSVSSPR